MSPLFGRMVLSDRSTAQPIQKTNRHTPRQKEMPYAQNPPCD